MVTILTIHIDVLHNILQGLSWRDMLAARTVCREMHHKIGSMVYNGEYQRTYQGDTCGIEVTYTVGPTLTQLTLSSVVVRRSPQFSSGNRLVDARTVGQYTIACISYGIPLNTLYRYLYLKDARMKYMITIDKCLPIRVVSSAHYMNPWTFLINYCDGYVDHIRSVLHSSPVLLSTVSRMNIPSDLYSEQLLSLLA